MTLDAARLVGRRVLVTGGTGAIGRAVTEALVSARASVRLLVRRPVQLAGVDTCVGDVTDEAALTAATAGVELVLHLAALLHVTDPPSSLAAEYTRVNDIGTSMLVQAARHAGVERLVYFSTIAVYGPSLPGEPLRDETSPCAPDSDYARSKLAAERHVLEANAGDGRQTGVVLRLSAVYGAGVKGNYRRLLEALARRRYLQIGPGNNRRTLVHEADVARAALLAATHPAAAGQIFNVTDGSVHTVTAIVDAIRAALGHSGPVRHVPLVAAHTAAAAVEQIARVMGRAPFVSRNTIHKLTEDVAIDGQRLRHVLGFTPAFDLRAGWKETVDRLQAQGELGPAPRTGRGRS